MTRRRSQTPKVTTTAQRRPQGATGPSPAEPRRRDLSVTLRHSLDWSSSLIKQANRTRCLMVGLTDERENGEER
jgi:hypothetical protein